MYLGDIRQTSSTHDEQEMSNESDINDEVEYDDDEFKMEAVDSRKKFKLTVDEVGCEYMKPIPVKSRKLKSIKNRILRKPSIKTSVPTAANICKSESTTVSISVSLYCYCSMHLTCV